LEYRVVRPDGTVRVVWAEPGELVCDETGKPAVLTGIVQGMRPDDFGLTVTTLIGCVRKVRLMRETAYWLKPAQSYWAYRGQLLHGVAARYAADDPQAIAVAAVLAGVHVIRVTSEWDALDKLALSEVDLIVCNASMKVAGDKPLYRVLWNVRPELKKCCTLIISPHRVPASARDGKTRGAITRPVTADMIRELLTSL
jgi:hypothetical protein